MNKPSKIFIMPLLENQVPEMLKNAIKIRLGLDKLLEVKRSEALLYSDITGGVVSKLVRLVGEKMDNRARIKILTEIIESKGFEQRYQNAERSTATNVFGTIKEHDAEYGDNVNAAKALNGIGYDVYVLPRVSGSKSFDYIIAKGGKKYAAELKTIYGENSLNNRLNAANEQSDRVILNMVGNASSRYVADELKGFYSKNPHVKEIIVLKSGKPIYVDYRHTQRKNFVRTFMDKWAR